MTLLPSIFRLSSFNLGTNSGLPQPTSNSWLILHNEITTLNNHSSPSIVQQLLSFNLENQLSVAAMNFKQSENHPVTSHCSSTAVIQTRTNSGLPRSNSNSWLILHNTNKTRTLNNHSCYLPSLNNCCHSNWRTN